MSKTKAAIKIDLKKLAKRVRDRNYRFSKLTGRQKRIRIAKDVIAEIEAGKIVAEQNGYLNLPSKADELLDSKERLDELEMELEDAQDPWDGEPNTADVKRIQKEMARIQENLQIPLNAIFEENKCTVCAIGGAFVAAVKRVDGLKVGDLSSAGDSTKMREYLSEWFSYEQLGLIEAAFEKAGHFAEDQGVSYYQASAAARFGLRYEESEDRMIAIMENIIENKGEFRP